VQNELPVFVYNYVSPLDQVTAGGSVGPCAFTSFSQPTALTVMVTNRQAWIYNQGGGGSWKNVTSCSPSRDQSANECATCW